MGFLDFAPIVVLFVAVPLVTQGENLQSWSHHAYKDDSYSLECGTDKVNLSATDMVSWTRHGMADPLANDDHFELRAKDGVPNVELFVKKVTDDTKGIYICHIHDSGSVLLDSVLQGLNIGEHMYHDNMDKYREGIIIGLIAAACVFGFIIIIGLISHFRYLSEESLEKRRQRKEAHLRREQKGYPMSNTAYENGGSNVDGETESSVQM